MFVTGDAGLDLSAVAEIIDDGHRAGVGRIGILTSQSSWNSVDGTLFERAAM